MRGELVIVRAAGDEPLVRKIWEATPEFVYICSDESYVRVQAAGPQPDCFPIGFPRQYVFKYDEKIARQWAGKTNVDPNIWKRLSVWSEHGNG